MIFRLSAMLALALLACGQSAPNPWRADEVVQTVELAKQFQASRTPMIIMVGPRILYNGNHITGAAFAGPAGSDAGLELLKHQTVGLRKDQAIVLYCGCCPMDHCPNIRPAFTALHGAGFTNVKILELPTNLVTDWTGKGYPVEKGSVAK